MSGVASRRHLRDKYVWAHSQMWCSFDVSLEIVQYDSDWTMWDWIVVGLSVELLQQETKSHHPMKQEVFSCSVGRTLWHINFSLVQAAFYYWRELYPLFFGHGFADLERPHFRTPEKIYPLFSERCSNMNRAALWCSRPSARMHICVVTMKNLLTATAVMCHTTFWKR